jgi:hypothetical protein
MTTLRVSKAQVPSELRESMIKQFGAVAEPVEVTWHNPTVAQAALEFGARIAAWDAASGCTAVGLWESGFRPGQRSMLEWRPNA